MAASCLPHLRPEDVCWVSLTAHVDLEDGARTVVLLKDVVAPCLLQVVADSGGARRAALVAEDHFCGCGMELFFNGIERSET